jgi:hypothetical protein
MQIDLNFRQASTINFYILCPKHLCNLHDGLIVAGDNGFIKTQHIIGIVWLSNYGPNFPFRHLYVPKRKFKPIALFVTLYNKHTVFTINKCYRESPPANNHRSGPSFRQVGGQQEVLYRRLPPKI